MSAVGFQVAGKGPLAELEDDCASGSASTGSAFRRELTRVAIGGDDPGSPELGGHQYDDTTPIAAEGPSSVTTATAAPEEAKVIGEGDACGAPLCW
jgi:hypothetical protein